MRGDGRRPGRKCAACHGCSEWLFATAEYTVIGTVADSAAGDQSLELSHVVVPYTPQATSAVVLRGTASSRWHPLSGCEH